MTEDDISAIKAITIVSILLAIGTIVVSGLFLGSDIGIGYTITEDNQMKTYSLENRPDGMTHMKKKGTIYVKFIREPFRIVTQEGTLLISPDTVQDWDGGYNLAYPSDGSFPYAISKSFLESNYVNNTTTYSSHLRYGDD